MINREVRHNFDKMLPESVDPEKLETWDDYVRRMDAQTREAFRIAREEIGKSVLLQKKYYDRTSHLIKYKVGDAVLIRDHRHHESGTKKLSDKYDGPYYVLDVLSDVSFRLSKGADQEPKVIHHDRMKLFHQREKPNLDWVFQQSRTHNKKIIHSRDGNEAMAEIMDKVVQLENQIKNTAGRNSRLKKRIKEKRKVEAPKKPAEVEEPEKPENMQQPAKRKRGRPRTKPDPPQPKEGTRRSDRLKAKK